MEKENKKILNATPKEFDGIKFKSILEVMVYKTLLSEGFGPEYEKNKFVIWQGFYPIVPFYDKDISTRMLKLNKKKVMDITYTPDFTFYYKRRLIIIEVKGFENDVFPVKKKLFRKVLERDHPEALFFEIYTKKQLLQAIQIIKKL